MSYIIQIDNNQITKQKKKTYYKSVEKSMTLFNITKDFFYNSF
jgi:hypothetical protein